MLTETPPAPTVRGMPLDRFVDGLFAPLAWEATVWLGDPAIASRLVERVLHRVWEERERFATSDALLRHAQDSARGAIQREAERRLDVTRFDGAAMTLPVPGDLQSMSVEAVRRRLHEGRRPAPTPSVPMPAIPAVAAPPAEVARPTPSMAPPPRASGATSAAPIRLSHATTSPLDGARRSVSRPKLHGAAYIEEHAGRRWSPRVVGGVVAVAALVLAVGWRATHSAPPLARAIAALADTTGLSKTTARGQQADVTLPGSATVHLGPGADVRASATFEHGPRAMRLSGPVRVVIPTDSSAPTVIATGAHRWSTFGAVAAFTSNGAQVLVRVDSGVVELLADSVKGRVTAGQAASMDPVTGFALLSSTDAAAAFAWRDGRLVLARGPVRHATAAALQWFDLDVRYEPERTAADSIAVDVPLATPDSLIATLAALADGRLERNGRRVLIKAGSRPAVASGSGKPVFATPAPAIPGLFDKP